MKPMTLSEMASLGGDARARALTKARRLAIAIKASKAAQSARKKKALDLAGKVDIV